MGAFRLKGQLFNQKLLLRWFQVMWCGKTIIWLKETLVKD